MVRKEYIDINTEMDLSDWTCYRDFHADTTHLTGNETATYHGLYPSNVLARQLNALGLFIRK